jgi:hypothetical protein
VLNSLLAVVIILISAFVFLSVNPISQEDNEEIVEFKDLTVSNRQDIIEFSLNLYYLTRNRYPESLVELKRERFLEEGFSLENWSYYPNRTTFQLQFIKGWFSDK